MYLLLLLQQIVASSTHIFAKNLTYTLHPAVVVLYRGAFALLAYAVWLVFRRKSVLRIEVKDMIPLLLLGLINIPMNQLMFVWGLKYTTAPNAALAYALSPAFVLLLSWLFMGEKLSGNKAVGVVVAIVGSAIILNERGFDTRSELFFGNIIELCASLSWALYTVFGRKVALKYGAVYTTALSMFIGFFLYLPLYSVLPVQHVAPQVLNAEQWMGLLYLGVMTSGVGFALWYYLLTKLEAGKVAVFNNLQPVLTTLIAVIYFRQYPSPMFILGGLIVLVGVIITQRK